MILEVSLLIGFIQFTVIDVAEVNSADGHSQHRILKHIGQVLHFLRIVGVFSDLDEAGGR